MKKRFRNKKKLFDARQLSFKIAFVFDRLFVHFTFYLFHLPFLSGEGPFSLIPLEAWLP